MQCRETAWDGFKINGRVQSHVHSSSYIIWFVGSTHHVDKKCTSYNASETAKLILPAGCYVPSHISSPCALVDPSPSTFCVENVVKERRQRTLH